MISNSQRSARSKTRRYWLSHWKNIYWQDDVNKEGTTLRRSGGNSYRKRSVSVGDVVYIVSLKDGHLLLGGRMTVERIVSWQEAVRLAGKEPYPAEEWVIARERSGTPLHLHRRLAPDLSRQLLFISPKGPPKPFFFIGNDIDVQATRGVRELTPESAALFDAIITITDEWPRPRGDEFLTVTKDFRSVSSKRSSRAAPQPLDDISTDTGTEGTPQQRLVTRYERSQRARAACIRHHGTRCLICEFDFGAAYGDAAAGVIHVHHLHPLATVGVGYQPDPTRDLVPLCANCHTVVHLRQPPYSVDEVRIFRARQRAMSKRHGRSEAGNPSTAR